MGTRFDHPVLGEMLGTRWEWRVVRETFVPCAGYSTRNIFLPVDDDGLDAPNPRYLKAAVDFLATPVAFRDEIAGAVFRAYVTKIRPEYFELLSDTRYEYTSTLADLPEVQEPNDIWKVVTGLYYVHINEDATVHVEYSVTFDRGHELHVHIDGRNIESVWME